MPIQKWNIFNDRQAFRNIQCKMCSRNLYKRINYHSDASSFVMTSHYEELEMHSDAAYPSIGHYNACRRTQLFTLCVN